MTWDRKGRNYILSLDLETTGSEDDDYILEIGAAITDREWNEIDAKQIVLPITTEMEERLPDVVRQMHTVNGLLEDSRALRKQGDSLFIMPEMMLYNQAIEAADKELTAWVKKYNGSDHMPFAGSGVMHFDRKYIKRQLPKFDKRITHWALDSGSVRRHMELAGIQLTASSLGAPLEKTHRALDDVRVHLAEEKRWMAWARDRQP